MYIYIYIYTVMHLYLCQTCGRERDKKKKEDWTKKKTAITDTAGVETKLATLKRPRQTRQAGYKVTADKPK